MQELPGTTPSDRPASGRGPVRIVGTALLAGGVLIVALVLGFIVAMVAAVTLGSLMPVDPAGIDPTPEIVRAVIVYLIWGICAILVFAFIWRRLRAT